MSDATGNVDLVGHVVRDWRTAEAGEADNLILKSADPELAWATEAMAAVGAWHARLRSVYLQWCLSINGLCVARDLYDSADYAARDSAFTVRAFRMENGVPGEHVVAQWNWSDAAENHFATTRKMAVFGIVDLYSNLEQCIFDFALMYYRQHPDVLFKGPEFAELRRLRRQAQADSSMVETWEAALQARLDTWQRNRLYDGLEKVLLTFFTHAGLAKPTRFSSGPQEWAGTLRLFGMVRNSLVHGAQTISRELALQSNGSGMDFVEGQPLEVSTGHLQSFELFTSQLLTAFNLALVERVAPPGEMQ